jgi:hypothetical protein
MSSKKYRNQWPIFIQRGVDAVLVSRSETLIGLGTRVATRWSGKIGCRTRVTSREDSISTALVEELMVKAGREDTGVSEIIVSGIASGIGQAAKPVLYGVLQNI